MINNGELEADRESAVDDKGLRDLNLSLDTKRRERDREITGKDKLGEVLAGLEKASALRFLPLKITFVVLAVINSD